MQEVQNASHGNVATMLTLEMKLKSFCVPSQFEYCDSINVFGIRYLIKTIHYHHSIVPRILTDLFIFLEACLFLPQTGVSRILQPSLQTVVLCRVVNRAGLDF